MGPGSGWEMGRNLDLGCLVHARGAGGVADVDGHGRELLDLLGLAVVDVGQGFADAENDDEDFTGGANQKKTWIGTGMSMRRNVMISRTGCRLLALDSLPPTRRGALLFRAGAEIRTREPYKK